MEKIKLVPIFLVLLLIGSIFTSISLAETSSLQEANEPMEEKQEDEQAE